MKKTDIDNFENYLDTYLHLLRKFKKIKSKNTNTNATKILNTSLHSIQTNQTHFNKSNQVNETSFGVNHTTQNTTQITIHNIITNNTVSIVQPARNLSSHEGNITLLYKNVTTIIPQANLLIRSNWTNELGPNNKTYFQGNASLNKNNHSKKVKPKVNKSLFNITNNIDDFLLNYKINDTVAVIQSNISNINANSSGSNLSHNFTKTNSNFKNINISTTINYTHNNTNFTSANINANSSEENYTVTKTTVPIDMIYNNLKNKKLNEEFEQSQIKIDKTYSDVDAENIESISYKKIINISLSLVVIGLMMGILLGLMLVMYLNSKKF